MRLDNHSNKRVMREALFFCTVFTLLFLLASNLQANPDEDSARHERVLSMYEEYKKKFSDIPDIPTSVALSLLSDTSVVFVDVRESAEQKVSMIPGAVTTKEFLKDFGRFRQMKIIAYCTIGYRSGKFAVKMRRKGVKVWNLQGGLLGWVHGNGPLENEDGPTYVLHVYGKTWDISPSWITSTY